MANHFQNDLPAELVQWLACPRCRGKLDLKTDELVCSNCQVAYPINHNIPTLLAESAVPIGNQPKNDPTDND